MTDWIPVRKGLRQGDPLSPLLYNFVVEPLLCRLRDVLDGIQLPGFRLRTLAFADDVAVGVGSEEDTGRLHAAISLHEQASAAKLNHGKTELIPVGRPRFRLEGTPLAEGEHTRYLGILFTRDGLDAKATQAKLLSQVTAVADRWQDRSVSLIGRVLLANACLLAKCWYVAHVVPFDAAFEKALRARIRQFIWRSKRNRVAEATITRPKMAGGLGLLPFHEQALATFGTFATQMVWLQDRPPWALVAAFLDRIQASPPARPSPVALKDVMAGLPLWSKTVPSMAVFHAAAVWQIYRAHTEALLDNKVVPALTMLGRWQGSMKLRIKFDLIAARKADKLDQFESHWTKTKCKWFAFEPGGGGVGCERLVFDPACYAPNPPPAGNDE